MFGRKQATASVGLGNFFVGVVKETRVVHVKAMLPPGLDRSRTFIYGAPTLAAAAVFLLPDGKREKLCKRIAAIAEGIPSDDVADRLSQALPLGVDVENDPPHVDFAWMGEMKYIAKGNEAQVVGLWKPSEGLGSRTVWLSVAALWLTTRSVLGEQDAVVIDHAMDNVASAYLRGTVDGDNMEAAVLMPHTCVQHAVAMGEMTVSSRRFMASLDE